MWPGEVVRAAKVQHDLLQSHLALLVKELATDPHRANEFLPWELGTWEGREASHSPSPLIRSKSKLHWMNILTMEEVSSMTEGGC